MHICLLPTEILLHIFTINYCKGHRLSLRSRATLAALARTCRKFKEPALDILWKHIIGFKPFISCLPDGITDRNMQGSLMLKMPLLNEEWGLIDRYTRRIHSFSVGAVELDMISYQGTQSLMSAPSPTPLLPNLRSLRWCDQQEHFFPLLRNFFAPTITSIQLCFRSSPPSFAQSALLASLGARCPSIQELKCAGVGDSEESSDAFCEALCDLRELRRLETGVLNPRVLLSLAALPSLKALQFHLVTYNVNEMQLDSPTIFSRLTRVYISATQSVINNCFRSVRFPSCHTGKVYVNYSDLDRQPEDPYNPLDIPDLIVSLSECFSPALQRLQFEFDFEFDVLSAETLANPSFALSFNALAPLLSFSRLTSLRLDWICTSAIDDASLKSIAQSLPRLEHFYFGGKGRWLIAPSTTFVGLFHLIQNCPRLRTLHMTFSAFAETVPFDTDPFFFETIPNWEITRIHVGMSPIDDCFDVATMLLELMPKLIEVLYFRWYEDDVPAPPPFQNIWGEWSMVNELLGLCDPSREVGEGMDETP